MVGEIEFALKRWLSLESIFDMADYSLLLDSSIIRLAIRRSAGHSSFLDFTLLYFSYRLFVWSVVSLVSVSFFYPYFSSVLATTTLWILFLLLITLGCFLLLTYSSSAFCMSKYYGCSDSAVGASHILS